MKSTLTAAAVLLAGTALLATPAVAQSNYGAQAAPQQPTAPAAEQTPPPQPKVSQKVAKPLKELQAAVQANNGAEVQAKVAEASALAKTADDKYMIGALEYKYAAAAKNDSMRAAALEQMIASGFKGAPLADLYGDLGST
ncbi:MAG TPA: hypothetical protein VFL74_05345, partial [Sphingomicrobium sp.]|nr:hypothetical protein [Sphingomicrobium sp.]